MQCLYLVFENVNPRIKLKLDAGILFVFEVVLPAAIFVMSLEATTSNLYGIAGAPTARWGDSKQSRN